MSQGTAPAALSATSQRIVGAPEDEQGAPVRSERLLEIDIAGGVPIRAGE